MTCLIWRKFGMTCRFFLEKNRRCFLQKRKNSLFLSKQKRIHDCFFSTIQGVICSTQPHATQKTEPGSVEAAETNPWGVGAFLVGWIVSGYRSEDVFFNILFQRCPGWDTQEVITLFGILFSISGEFGLFPFWINPNFLKYPGSCDLWRHTKNITLVKIPWLKKWRIPKDAG